jgi:hypothetical protein
MAKSIFDNELSENINSDITNNHTTFEQDEVNIYINSTSRYVNLPRRDGEALTYQFFTEAKES